MATTEQKARTFVKAVEDAAAEAKTKLQIANEDVTVSIRIDIEKVFTSEFPKEG